MIYHIRVVGPERDLGGLGDYADIVAAPTHDGAILSCDVPDPSALTGVVALLCDLGVDIAELRAVRVGAGRSAAASSPAGGAAGTD